MSGSLIGVIGGEVADLLLSPRRGFGKIIPDVVIDESHADILTITEHPVESGAPIADHAYLRPAEVKVRMGFSPSSPYFDGLLGSLIPISSGLISQVAQLFNGGPAYLETIYQAILTAQATREPMELTTGKRTYQNMLMESVLVETDREKENSLHVTINFRQVIIVRTRTAAPLEGTQAPASDQESPQATAAPADTGTQQPQETPTDPGPPEGEVTVEGIEIVTPSATSPTGFRDGANIPAPAPATP